MEDDIAVAEVSMSGTYEKQIKSFFWSLITNASTHHQLSLIILKNIDVFFLKLAQCDLWCRCRKPFSVLLSTNKNHIT